MISLVQAMLGKLPRDRYTYMTARQRIDFTIMIIVFGVLVGVCVASQSRFEPHADHCIHHRINAFTILTAQQLVCALQTYSRLRTC